MSNKAERKGRGKGGKFKKNKKATTLSTEDVDYLVARYNSLTLVLVKVGEITHLLL